MGYFSGIIRSHGISADVYHQLEDKKVRIVDATCPFVSKIHRIVEKKYQEGSCIVIVGNANHPEVEGINGWCNGAATVIGSVSEAENYSQEPARKLCVVAQTTFNYKKFKDIVDIFSKKSYDINVMNTICNATEERQTEAAAIAGDSDAMIVIGGKHSSTAPCSRRYTGKTVHRACYNLSLYTSRSVQRSPASVAR